MRNCFLSLFFFLFWRKKMSMLFHWSLTQNWRYKRRLQFYSFTKPRPLTGVASYYRRRPPAEHQRTGGGGAAAACKVPAYWRRTPEWYRIRRPAFCPEICRSQTCVPMIQHRHRCGTDSMRLAANSAKNYCCCFYYKLEISFSFHA